MPSADRYAILALMDSASEREALNEFFTQRNYRFHGFQDLKQALQDVYQQEYIPDVILLDLPEADMLAAASAFHKDKHLSLIPILLFFDPQHQLSDRLLASGAADFIARPFQPEQVMQLIHTHETTRRKWWQTFHIEGPKNRDEVLHALKTAREAKSDFSLPPAETPHSDDFNHFKEHFYQRMNLSMDRIQRLKNFRADEVYELGAVLEVDSLRMARYMAEFLHLDSQDQLDGFEFAPGLIPFQFCKKNFVVPLKDRFGRLHIALANPFELEVVDILNRLFKSYHLLVVAPQLLLQLIDPEYFRSAAFRDWQQSLELHKRKQALFTRSQPLSSRRISARDLAARVLPHDLPPAVPAEAAAASFPDPQSLAIEAEAQAEEAADYFYRGEGDAEAASTEEVLPQETLAPLGTSAGHDHHSSQSELAEEMEQRLMRAYQAYRQQKFKDPSQADVQTAVDNLIENRDPEVAPIIHLVNSLIEKAYLMEASDIHIEPWENEVLIRYRVDGALRVMHHLQPREIIKPIIARLKILSSLDISEKRLPQDGRIHFMSFSQGHEIDIDIRLSIVPLQYGEKAVMRLLDRKRSLASLENMGFSEQDLSLYRKKLVSPYGMILHVGPTGSGKTTTLYSALSELNDPEVNIHTIENPVEYSLQGVNQLEVNHDIGLNFARVLRSYLRQDPDIILVGEIRDDETAHIAVEAAMTGHLLLSTLHTNDAASTVVRLLEMGIKPYMISSSLLMICAQRLLRRLCDDCKTPYQPDPAIKKMFGLPEDQPVTLYEPVGCEACEGSGYRGRVGVFEILAPDDRVRKIMTQPDVTAEQIKATAIEQLQMRTLFQDALDKALQGITSLEEVTLKILPDG